MKVCHFVGTTLSGQYFVNLANGLPAHGVSLIFSSLSKEKTPEWLNQYTHIPFYNLGTSSRRHYPWAIIKLASMLRREKVDILQMHLFDGGIVGLAAAKLAGTPITIYTRHHSDLIHQVGKTHHIALDRWMAQQATRVVAVSYAARDFMVSQDKVKPNKIDVIQLGFDFKKINATIEDGQRVRNEFGFLPENFIIGTIGSFFKTKGHKYLLAALKTLVKQIPNVRLLLLGSGDRTEIDRQISELQLNKYVVFAGYRNDVPACLKAMDLVVHPSLSEAFCQVLIETMAAGTALIATDVGGAREVITDGENAILIPPAGSDAIVDSVLQLYHYPQLRQQLAIAGFNSVRTRFTVERMITEQVQRYQHLLKKT